MHFRCNLQNSEQEESKLRVTVPGSTILLNLTVSCTTRTTNGELSDYYLKQSENSICLLLEAGITILIQFPIPSAAMPGFDFSNHNRNAALHAQGVPLPKATSTGTTIVGAIFDGGVVIAADTRATSGPIVADKVHPSP